MNNNVDKIDPDEIANISDIPLLQSLRCSIDLIIPLHPVICSQCENVFCQDCLKEWKKKSKNCPLCKTIFIESKRKNTILTQQLQSIRLYCKFKENGCTYHPLKDEKKEHEKTCPFQWKPCSKCGNNYIQKKYLNHIIENCSAYFILCFYCNTNMSIMSLKNHLLNDCNGKIKSKADSITINKNIEVSKCEQCGCIELVKYVNNNLHKCPNQDEKSINNYYILLLERYKSEYEKTFVANKIILDKWKGNTFEQADKIERVINFEIDVLDNEIEKKYKQLEKKKNIIKEKLHNEIRMQIKENQKLIEKIEEKDKELKMIPMLIQKEEMLFKKMEREYLEFLTNEINIKKEIIKNIANKEIKNNLNEVKQNNNIKLEKENNQSISLNNNIIVTEKEVNGICLECKKVSNNINKCEICLKLICPTCNKKCACKMHGINPNEITIQTLVNNNNSNTVCKECIFKCNRCYNNICKHCYKQCFYSKCKTNLCIGCYYSNSHQIKHSDEPCGMFTCCSCKRCNICIMTTIFCKDRRECSECFHAKGLSNNDFLFI